MDERVATNLAHNLRQLREARGLTQQQCSGISGVPRPTWANLESGGANPTLAVLVRAAAALQVSVEELISAPRAQCKLYRAAELPGRDRGGVGIRQLLPDTLVGLQMQRMELRPGARMRGIPHTPGTREYLTCEVGRVRLAVAGEQWSLEEGDVLVFRGDQNHSYHNPARGRAVAYSVVVLAPGGLE